MRFKKSLIQPDNVGGGSITLWFYRRFRFVYPHTAVKFWLFSRFKNRVYIIFGCVPVYDSLERAKVAFEKIISRLCGFEVSSIETASYNYPSSKQAVFYWCFEIPDKDISMLNRRFEYSCLVYDKKHFEFSFKYEGEYNVFRGDLINI